MCNKKIKVSIITAVLNGENTILENIKSVQNQNYSNIEHIIVDGKSKDKTLKIILAHKHKNLSFISEKDTGLYSAINKGISLAKGSIIGILNADDYFYRFNIIQKIVTVFTKKNPDIVFTDVKVLSDKNKPLYIYSAQNFLIEHLTCGLMPPHPGIFLQKKVYKNHGLFDANYKIAADFDFLFRVLRKEPNSQKVKTVSVCMRKGGKSTKNISSKIIINIETKRILKTYGLSYSLYAIFKKYFLKKTKYYIPVK